MRNLGLFVLLLQGAYGEGPPAVAVVSALEGNARLVSSIAPRDIKLHDWLPAGTNIMVGAESRLTLVFANGRRFRLGADVSAKLAEERPLISSGAWQELEPLPPLPKLAAIGDKRTSRSAGIRLRNPQAAVHKLYPRAGTATIPDSTILRFQPLTRGATYRIDLHDSEGNTVFQTKTSSTAVAVPAGTLKPGRQYYWEVRALGVLSPVTPVKSEFETLNLPELEERSSLHAALAGLPDWEALALRAEVDRRSGLLLEALESLRAALALAPMAEDLRSAVKRLETEMEEAAVNR